MGIKEGNMVVNVGALAAASATLVSTASAGRYRRVSVKSSIGRVEETPKGKNTVTPPALLEKRFNQAWERQKERLSKLIKPRPDYFNGACKFIDKYENGVPVERSDSKRGRNIQDDMGNVIFHENQDSSYDDAFYPSADYRCEHYVYYPNSNQKEFEWTEEGIKHFDKSGKENTKSYYGKLKIALKRREAEEKDGVTFPKMSRVEKIVSRALVDTVDPDKMTVLEKMLVRKARKVR